MIFAGLTSVIAKAGLKNVASDTGRFGSKNIICVLFNMAQYFSIQQH